MIKRIIYSLLGLFVAYFIPHTSSAEELCVNPSDPVCYSSIGEAVTVAISGDTILVAPGTYAGFSCNEDLTIKGEDPINTVISSTGTGIDVTGNTLNLSGFYITAGYNGIYVYPSARLNVSNTIIAGCGQSGIHTHKDSWNCSIINNTIAFNASNGLSFNDPDYGHTAFNNVICFNNEYGIRTDYYGGYTSPICEYNNVYGNTAGGYFGPCSAGAGSISLDPLFIDHFTGDFRIQSISLCIDAGNPSRVYLDPDGTRNDIGAYGGPKASSFCQYPDCGPVVTSILLDLVSIPQGDTITIQATAIVRE